MLTKLSVWWLNRKGYAIFWPKDIPPSLGVTLSGPGTVAIGDRHTFRVFNPTGYVAVLKGAHMIADSAEAASRFLAKPPSKAAPKPYCGPIGGMPWGW